MVSCISNMHPTLIKAIGCVTGLIKKNYAEKHQLPSMTSKCSQTGKRLMIYSTGASFENSAIFYM